MFFNYCISCNQRCPLSDFLQKLNLQAQERLDSLLVIEQIQNVQAKQQHLLFCLNFIVIMFIQNQKASNSEEHIIQLHSSQTQLVNIIRKKSAKFVLQHEPKNETDAKTQWTKPPINKSITMENISSETRLLNRLSSRSLKLQLLPKTEELFIKKVLILYISGAAGANQNVEIIRGFLRTKMAENQYFSDYKMQQNLEDRSFLVTPEQQNGMRILYKVEEFNKIALSINITFQTIKQIAQKIHQNYKKYDAFIILCGLDTICYVATILSFMFQNLSKLIIFTGGYFPISYMRNDTVNNLIESFAIISQAQNFNDVIIVSKNKGYRANRCIKMKQGDLNAISSPNIDALVSVNIKIKFRQYLFLPTPTGEFRIWTDLNLKVGIIHYEILMSKQALEYILLNPAYQGFVIQTYAANTLPDNLQILNLFKRIAEEKGKIFVTTSQSIYKSNNSLKKEYLQEFSIFYGGDMTTEAALAKLSYLYSKNYSRNQIRKLLHTNMRGELTEIKNQNRFSFQNHSFMEIVTSSIKQFYPTSYYGNFITKIEDQICDFVVKGQSPKDLEQLFKNTLNQSKKNEQAYSETIVDLVNRNYLLHKAVKYKNQNLYKYFLNFNVDINHLDESDCTPLYYAIAQKDKKAIVYLSKKGGFVICPSDELFQMIVKEIKEDNALFFELLYHIEFKETLPQETNIQGRNALHLCAILGAQKCLKYLLQKFKFNIKVKDIYGKLYLDYKKIN